MAVFVVAKKIRVGCKISSGQALRPGRAIAGTEALPFLHLLRHD